MRIRCGTRAGRQHLRSPGLTLVELLVAVAMLALLAALSWRALDGMVRARAQTEEHAERLLVLEAALGQWTADLEAMTQPPFTRGIEWNGQVLRLTRTDPADAGGGLRVVAWTRRIADGRGQWLRWTSAPVRQRGDWERAWQQALLWAQNPDDALRRRELAIVPIDEWRIFFYRGDAWTNPLSSDAVGPAAGTPGAGAPADSGVNLPDGVRLVLRLSPGAGLTGTLQRDWARPTIAGGRS